MMCIGSESCQSAIQKSNISDQIKLLAEIKMKQCD